MRGAADGRSWRRDAVDLNAGGYLALWVEGLAENADRNNVRVYWNQRRLPVEFVARHDASDTRQINVRVPGSSGSGAVGWRFGMGTLARRLRSKSVENV